MSKVDVAGDYIVGEDYQAESGETELQFRMNRVPDEVLAAERANRHLKTHGGRGDTNVALVDGTVKTIKETIAVAIAKDMADDACRRTGKRLNQLNLLELNEGIDQRCKGRAVGISEVAAELARLQNTAIYGDVVRRR